jgi:periplasmic copper chaperone A
MKKQMFALLASITFASAAFAQVTVTAPWVRATVPQQKTAGAFMQLRSARDAHVVGVRSPVAGIAEIHEMKMEGHMMRMHAVERIELPAGKDVNLGSGGYHIMLMNLNRQLKDGETVPVTLIVQDRNGKRDNVTVDVPVKPITFVSPQAAAPSTH